MKGEVLRAKRITEVILQDDPLDVLAEEAGGVKE